jgi:GTPase SAR1 family protein
VAASLSLTSGPLGSGSGLGLWAEPCYRELCSELTLGLSSVGGSQNLRFYWKEFVNEVDVLVFMVDSTDRLRLPWARQELQKLLDRDPDLPVVIVANKQVSAMGGEPVGLLTDAWA